MQQYRDAGWCRIFPSVRLKRSSPCSDMRISLSVIRAPGSGGPRITAYQPSIPAAGSTCAATMKILFTVPVIRRNCLLPSGRRNWLIYPKQLFGAGNSDRLFLEVLQTESFWQISRQKLFAVREIVNGDVNGDERRQTWNVRRQSRLYWRIWSYYLYLYETLTKRQTWHWHWGNTATGLWFAYEVVVVDNMSDDDSVKIAEGFGARVLTLEKSRIQFWRFAQLRDKSVQREFILILSAHVLLLSDGFCKVSRLILPGLLWRGCGSWTAQMFRNWRMVWWQAQSLRYESPEDFRNYALAAADR